MEFSINMLIQNTMEVLMFNSIKSKILLTVTVLFISVALFIFSSQSINTYQQLKKTIITGAEGILIQGENIRKNFGRLHEAGIFKNQLEDLKKRAVEAKIEGNEAKYKAIINEFMNMVPVVQTMKTLKEGEKDGGYLFRVPKEQPRNPINTPDDVERTVLSKYRKGEIKGTFVVEGKYKDPQTGKERKAIRVFRPIYLTEDCLICHGDPARSYELWGNREGRDLTGGQMENWKAGEIRGAFEIIYFIDTHLNRLYIVMGLLAIATFVILLIALYWIRHFMTKNLEQPLNQVIDVTERIAQGDLSYSFTYEREDELKRLVTALEQMRLGLIELVKGLLSSFQELLQTTGLMKEKSLHLDESAINLSKITDMVNQKIVEINIKLSEVSQSFQQMNTVIQEINQNVFKTTEMTKEAKTRADHAHQVVEKLAEASNKIGEIVTFINNIAEATNLLALNASIEAARAGEAGKGFAVVANEVKELAKQTQNATKDIEEMILEVQKNIESSISSIDAIREIVNQINDAANTIANATEEQTITVGKVNSNLQDTAHYTGAIGSSMEELIKKVVNLKEISKSNLDTAEKLKELADNLRDISNRFKLAKE